MNADNKVVENVDVRNLMLMQPHSRMQTINDQQRQMIAGSVAGGFTQLLLYPLDLVKVRLQVNSADHFAIEKNELSKRKIVSTRFMMTDILKHEGIVGFYRGIGPSLLASGLSWGLYFLFYENAKTRWNKWNDGEYNNSDRSSDRREPEQKAVSTNSLVNLIAGFEAGAISVLFTNPIWLIKTRMQLQRVTALHKNKKYNNSIHAFQTIIREEGPLALYRGVVPALWLCWHGAIQFLVYEELKVAVKNHENNNNNNNSIYFKAISSPLVLGAASKAVASTITYPAQVIKSRMQQYHDPHIQNDFINRNSKFFKSIVNIVKDEGFRGLYRGLGANLLRVTPSSGIMLMVYELVITIL